jgi:CheY-like chemotaxis protein
MTEPTLKKRVLVVDDEASFRYFLHSALEHAGYGVTAVASGEEALMRARCYDFDVIITDMIMPSMQGSELITRLRSGGTQTPIIAITGHPDGDACIADAEPFHVDCVLHKPFTLPDLCLMVERLTGSVCPQPIDENDG